MKIPVAHLVNLSIIGTIYYDTLTNKFEDSSKATDRILPLQDYTSCETQNNNIATVVGKIYSRNTYVCCFGDNFCYELTKQQLLRYNISNMRLINNKLYCIDGKLPDLSYLFPDSKIRFIDSFLESNQSSIGDSHKFYGKYNGRRCIIKFTKQMYSNKDLHNEIIYKKICDILNIKCCRVYLTKYYGRECIASIFEYTNDDIYISFKNLNKSLSNIIKTLNKEDKIEFDKYLLLDYIMLQQDRHFSNLAVVNDRLYQLFDNGECLGIGHISTFSQNFRTYIERQDNNYLKTLFTPSKSIYKYLNTVQKDIVQREVSKIW